MKTLIATSWNMGPVFTPCELTSSHAARKEPWSLGEANIARSPPMTTRYLTVFVMFIFTNSSRQTGSRQMATLMNQSSSGGIGGERDVHDMTVGAAKGETPRAKHSQRLGETHGASHPTRRTKVGNSESKFRLQARGSPLHRLSPSALTRVRALDLVAGSAPEPGGGRLGNQRQHEPEIPKDRRRLQRAGGKGRLRRRPAVADADVASLAVARGDDGPLLGPCLRALLPCADVPATSLDSPLPIAIRARKLSLHAEPLGRGAGLEVPRRTPRTPWPNGRRAPRLAAAARAVARGLHRMGGHHLLQ